MLLNENVNLLVIKKGVSIFTVMQDHQSSVPLTNDLLLYGNFIFLTIAVTILLEEVLFRPILERLFTAIYKEYPSSTFDADEANVATAEEDDDTTDGNSEEITLHIRTLDDFLLLLEQYAIINNINLNIADKQQVFGLVDQILLRHIQHYE